MILGQKSLNNLVGVHPDLVKVVHKAVEIIEFPFDFSVHEGLRTVEKQAHYVKTGASRNMDSRHLTGHAVDLVPYLNGMLRWEWPLIYPIAEAMRKAGKIEGVPIRWGGVWDLILTDTTDLVDDIVEDYVARMKAKHGPKFKVFTDGPHFELPASKYPK